jgi:hypothetical protein
MGGEGGQPRGKGEGRPSVEGRGVAAKKGQKGERATTRVSLWEKRNDATDDSDSASNGPQPFSHIHAPNINLWQPLFWDITPNNEVGRGRMSASHLENNKLLCGRVFGLPGL